MLDDSMLYSGVDNEPKGMFANEIVDEETTRKIAEQEQKIKELTPKLEGLIDIINSEITGVMSIDRFIGATTKSGDEIKAELQAAALYKDYLEKLKVRLTLDLQEAKR